MSQTTKLESDQTDVVSVPAKPEALDFPLSSTALIVVDMQNSYGSPGGFRDLIGRKMDGMREVIGNNVRVIEAARNAGLPIVFLQTGWDPELKSAGGPSSPNYHKSNPMKLMRERPELRGKDSHAGLMGLRADAGNRAGRRGHHHLQGPVQRLQGDQP